MNEKIRELAEQARAWVNNTDNVSPDIEYVFYKDAYDKKFAELIIKECGTVAGRDWDTAETAIYKHFGVKE